MDTFQTLVEDEENCVVRWKVDDFLKRTQGNCCLSSDHFLCGPASYELCIRSYVRRNRKKRKRVKVLINRSTDVLTSVQHSWKITVEGSDGTTLAEAKGVLKMHKECVEIPFHSIRTCIHPNGSLVLLCELHSIPEEILDASFPPRQNPGYFKEIGHFLCTLMLCLISIGCFLLQNFYQLFLLLARLFKLACSHIRFFRSSEDRSQSQERTRTDVLARDLGKLLSSGEASDVTVRVNGQREFHVHKAILIARTPVFGSMFRHQMSESETGIVDIEDCDPDTFQRFLRFIYTGSVEDLQPEDAIELYRVADKYQVHELRSMCLECISEGLSVQSVCPTISLAIEHDQRELTERAIEFFTDNVDDIVVSVQWQEFLSENPIQGNELFVRALRRRNARLEETHQQDATNIPPNNQPKTYAYEW